MRSLLSFCFTLVTLSCLGQDTIEVMSKFDKDLTEVYHVLKLDMKTREGLYQMRFKKKTAVASGAYKNDKRTGFWRFYDTKGKLMQVYNYDTQQVSYEAPEAVSPTPHFSYRVDDDFTKSDTVLKPIKIGGRYHGYLALLKLFKRPRDIEMGDASQIPAVVEVLVSPGGNLADYTIHIDGLDLNVNLNLLADEDKRFVPARKNGEPISCRILIPCRMTSGGRLLSISDLDNKQILAEQ